MKKQIACLFACFALMELTSCSKSTAYVGNQAKNGRSAYAIVIHGGAGTILKKDMTPEREKSYLNALNEALTIGETVLKNGGTAMEAVEKTIVYLEDCPLFNAGRGAVFTHESRHELDASVMDGATGQAGAVGGVSIVKNPIRAALAVMRKSPHVFLTGKGAEQFAIEQKLDTVPNSFFDTDERKKALQQALEDEKKTGSLTENTDAKFGTVGCVARDSRGNLAAGTSTGGMTNKRWNRLGDTPVIGAGTFADNATCAVSCTGHGEYFIRNVVAYDVSARMAYLKEDLATAADFVINKKLAQKNGEGGLIAVDAKGNIAMTFNSDGMYRGFARPGQREVKIYK